MIIRCIGHAEFLLELDNGLKIVTDPYDASCGYPVQPIQADVALVSHHHHDHDAVENLLGQPRVIDQEGVYDLPGGGLVRAVRAYHDDQKGKLRGETLLFLIQAEGLRVVHLGDLGHLLSMEQKLALAPADVLMVPVGGHFTIDAQQARATCEGLRAGTILPMHYRTQATEGWPIAPVSAFTSLWAEKVETLDLLRVTKGDLDCQPRLAVLRPQSLQPQA